MAIAQDTLDTMVGKTIVAATMEETRIVVETSDGNKYYFYGLMGSGGTAEPEEALSAR